MVPDGRALLCTSGPRQDTMAGSDLGPVYNGIIGLSLVYSQYLEVLHGHIEGKLVKVYCVTLV